MVSTADAKIPALVMCSACRWQYFYMLILLMAKCWAATVECHVALLLSRCLAAFACKLIQDASRICTITERLLNVLCEAQLITLEQQARLHAAIMDVCPDITIIAELLEESASLMVSHQLHQPDVYPDAASAAQARRDAQKSAKARRRRANSCSENDRTAVTGMHEEHLIPSVCHDADLQDVPAFMGGPVQAARQASEVSQCSPLVERICASLVSYVF